MDQKKKTAVLFAVLVLVLALAGFAYSRLSKDYKPQVPENSPANTAENSAAPAPKPAKDFTVYDEKGSEVKLSDFVGKPVVVNVWATWCGPCSAEMPEFEKAYKEHGSDIAFLMINLTGSDTVEAARNFIKENGFTFPIYYDKASSVDITYGISGIPMTYFINAKGELVKSFMGMIDPASLSKYINAIK